MLLKGLAITATALAASSTAFAQDYFEFGEIPGVSEMPAVQIELTPMLISIASQAARAQNPAVANLLENIDGVRVRVYAVVDDLDEVIEYVGDLSNRLARDNWQQVVNIQDDESVRVYVRTDGDVITGATAIVVGQVDAAFVNIAGAISSQQLAESLAALKPGDGLYFLDSLSQSGGFAFSADSLPASP